MRSAEQVSYDVTFRLILILRRSTQPNQRGHKSLIPLVQRNRISGRNTRRKKIPSFKLYIEILSVRGTVRQGLRTTCASDVTEKSM